MSDGTAGNRVVGVRPELLLVVGSIAACGERWTLVEPLVGDCRVQRSYHLDEDGDGWGEDGDARLACGPEAPYTALGPGDCDDGDAAVTGGGAVCPRDLVTVAAGRPSVRGGVAGGFEGVVVSGEGLRLSASQAEAACAAWGSIGGAAAVAGGLAGAPAAAWALDVPDAVAWTSAAWRGARGDDLAGSWADGWTGGWETPGGGDPEDALPWCSGEPTPAALAPDLSPADPDMSTAWDALLADARLVVRLGGAPCWDALPGDATALACVREATRPP